jgi:uncharacterized protein (DUF486 family)
MHPRVLTTVLLLAASNFFMNAAWYGHLKFKEKPLLVVILASWGIAFVEYCLQVPANRMGSESLSVTQLKVLQEVLSVATFVAFALIFFKEKFTYNHAVSFGFLVLAAYFAVRK